MASGRSQSRATWTLTLRPEDITKHRRFPIPDINHPVGLSTVDAIFEEQRVIVELDGVRGHSTERRILRDHRRDLHRRADGFQPLRYHFTQITQEQPLVAEDLERAGIQRI